MTLDDIEVVDPTDPIAPIVCGKSTTVNKTVHKTASFFYPTADTWPPANWAGLTQAQRNAYMNDVALDALNNSTGGAAVIAAMRAAATKAAQDDPGITCAPCAPVGELDPGICKKVAQSNPPVVVPGAGSPAPDPVVTNGSVATAAPQGGQAGWAISATFHFMYKVTVKCDKEGCRCTECGQFHPGPSQ